MWHGLYFKFFDSWTTPLHYLPRWFVPNSYPTLTDYITDPASSVFTNSLTISSPSGLLIPSSWELSSATPITTGSLLQQLFEAFSHEQHFYQNPLLSTYLARCMYFDEGDPELGFLIECLDQITELKINTLSGTGIVVQEARDDLDLFWSGDWRWKQEKNVILIYGIDLYQQTTEHRPSGTSSSWEFIKYSEPWTKGAAVFVEHPVSKNWYPLHSTTVREDGFLNLFYSGGLNLRTRNPLAIQMLSGGISVSLDGKEGVARRIHLFNSVDEKGLWPNLKRREGENNTNFGRVLTWAESFVKNQTYSGVRDFISIALRQGTALSLTRDSSGFEYGAPYSGYSVISFPQTMDLVEQKVNKYPETTISYLSAYGEATEYYAFVNGLYTTFDGSGGLITPDLDIDNRRDLLQLKFRYKFWTETGSSTVTFTDSIPSEGPNIIVYLPEKVRVTIPSLRTKKIIFNKTSNIFRWQAITDPLVLLENAASIGLAKFI